MRKSLILLIGTLALTGCSLSEPEGPAERIGKSIDELAKGVNDMSKDPNYVGDSHTRDSYNTQGSSNENYRSDDYWAESDEYWKSHDPKRVFKNEKEQEQRGNY